MYNGEDILLVSVTGTLYGVPGAPPKNSVECVILIAQLAPPIYDLFV